MGPLTSLLGMMPGFAGQQLKGLKVDERELDRVQAIILSMTPEERRRPELIKGSRRLRIAKGSGTNVQAVNQLVKQFGQMRKVMKQIGRGKMPDLGAHDAPGPLTSHVAFRSRSAHRVPTLSQHRRKDFHGSSTSTHPRGRQEEPDLARRRRRSALAARRPHHRDPRPLQRPDRALDDHGRRGARALLALHAAPSRPPRSASSCARRASTSPTPSAR